MRTEALARALVPLAALLVLALLAASPAGGQQLPPPPAVDPSDGPLPLAYDTQNVTEFSPNGSVSGTLAAGTERVFKVFANRSDASPETLTVTLGTFGGLFSFGWVEVFDPYQVLIDQRVTRFDGQVNVSQFVVAETGYYLLVLSSTNSYDWSLTVNWSAGTTFPLDNDNDLANATALTAAGGSVSANVTEWQDLYDTYRFDLITRGPSADAIVLNLTSPSASDIDLYVYHLEGGVAVIDSFSISPTNTEFVGHFAGADGPVYVRVLSYAGNSAYQLTWLLFDTVADANNRPEVASALPAGISPNNLSRWDGRDIFRIDAPANTTVNVTLHTQGWNSTSREPDLQAILWDASFERVTWSFLFDPNERIDALLVEPGVYYLEVYPRDIGYFLTTRMFFDYTMDATVDPPPLVQGGAWDGDLVEDTPAAFDLRVVLPPDPAGETITYTVLGVTGPVSATVAPDGFTLLVTPLPDAFGNATVSLRAADRWRSVDITLPVVVAPVNDAPRLRTGGGVLGFDEDRTGTLDPNVSALDPEGDAFSLVAVVAGAPLNTSVVAGAVVVTPPPDFHGVRNVVLTLRDERGAESNVTVQVEVLPVNDAPRFVGALGPLTVDEDASASAATFSLAGLALDPDGDPVVFTARGAPGLGVLVVGETLTLVPALDFHGAVTLMVDASDGSQTVTLAVPVQVVPLNDAPVLEPPAGQPVAREAEPFTLAVGATDVDTAASALRFSFWLDGVLAENRSQQGTFNHTFGFEDAGFHIVRVVVTDGELSAGADIAVYVGQTNRAPTAEVLTPAGATFATGEVIVISGRGLDPDRDALTYRWIVDGSLASQAETATLEGLAAGPHTAVLFVSDGELTVAAEVAFTVDEASPGIDAGLAAVALALVAAAAWLRGGRRLEP